MPDDPAAVRKQLADQWQAIGIELIRRGVAAEAVFETMLTVGLAGYVEIHGREASAAMLVEVARQLSEQLRQEAEALSEASSATKN